ncbi:hypothetical protein B6E66_08065 [Streptomyces maremycinicus]|nr:hypothetical protein B6E66_08065 [Streptomyces sp. B9173]
MGKHRKKEHYRRIVITAVTLTTVGVPSVALACTDWQDNGGHRLDGAGTSTAQHWRSIAARDGAGYGDRAQSWKGTGQSQAAPLASQTPTASPGTPQPTAPKPKAEPTSKSTSKPKPVSTPTPTPTPTRASSPPKAATAASATPASPSTSTAAAPASGTSARIVQLVNAERGKVGCSPVTLSAVLTKAAQGHSQDMAAHQNMSHTGSDGSSPGDRITRAGYAWSTYGENVAYGYATPEQVMAGWMGSPGHKANILNCAFKEIGVGLAQPGNYWTQDFGTAR